MRPVTAQEKAAILLRSLAPEAVEAILTRLGPANGLRLRQQLSQMPEADLEELADPVLREFGELLKNAGQASPPPPKSAAEPVGPRIMPRPAAEPGENESGAPEDAEEPDDPVEALRRLHPQGLALALQGEQARTVALVLNCLETNHAGHVLKRLPPEQRREVSLQLGKPVTGGLDLLRRVAGALVAKSRAAADQVGGPAGEDRYRKMADMLRLLDKPDRMEIITALDEHDPETAAKIKDFLYQFEDLLRIEDRSVQKLLTEIDSKSLALALKGASEEIREKVLSNLSKRARETLTEEMEFMGSVPPLQMKQAEKIVVDVIQRLDQAGELVMTEE